VREEPLTDGTIPLAARRLALDPGERLDLAAAGETLVYVIAGAGTAAGEPLARESVVFLEPGESCAIEAGPDGLELLQGTGTEGRKGSDGRDL
jgi:redox-sensitive bicupin YhaK (pirin superfamily)